ncbi:MAG: hypothetical protein ACRD5H_09785, partial [Nitrososphaerales archaeon]
MKQQGKVSYDLQGRTLQVYLYLMRKDEPSGIREIQRELNLSSPSVANYQIEKLTDLGLVGKDNHGRYYLLHRVQVPALKAYVNIGKFIVPRLIFYAGFFTTLLGLYLVLNANSLNVFAIAFGSAGTALFWYETFRLWKMSPVSIHVDLPEVKPFIAERMTILPYLALGIVIAAAGTIGFGMYSSFIGGYVQSHPEFYDPNSIDIETINTDSHGPADMITENLSLSEQKFNAATQQDAYGSG